MQINSYNRPQTQFKGLHYSEAGQNALKKASANVKEFVEFLSGINKAEEAKDEFKYSNLIINGIKKYQVKNLDGKIVADTDLQAKLLTKGEYEKCSILKGYYDTKELLNNKKSYGFKIYDEDSNRYYLKRPLEVKSAQYGLFDSRSDKPIKVYEITGENCIIKASNEVNKINEALENDSIDPYITIAKWDSYKKEEELEKLKNLDSEKLTKLGKELEVERAEKEMALSNDTRLVQEEFDKKLADYKNKCENELKSVQSEHTTIMRNIFAKNEAEISEAKAHHDAELAKINADIEQKRAELNQLASIRLQEKQEMAEIKKNNDILDTINTELEKDIKALKSSVKNFRKMGFFARLKFFFSRKSADKYFEEIPSTKETKSNLIDKYLEN